MPSSSLTHHLAKLFTTALILFGALFVAPTSHSQTCDSLFESILSKSARAEKRTSRDLVDESWRLVLEQDYANWLVEFQAAGIPIPEQGIGRALYMHWKMAPQVTAPLLDIGFKIVEPTAANPTELARFEFPKTFEVIAENIVKSRGTTPGADFKIATYNDSQWLPMDKKLPYGVSFGSGKDMGLDGYAQMMAAGYVPLWPSKRSLLIVHDLGHITELLEFPRVFPALKTFFSRYISEGWGRKADYRGRAEIFNEVSYILKPEKYKAIDSLLISGSESSKKTDTRATEIFDRLNSDREGTLSQVYRLTSRFNELFERHGGGARDAFNIESRFLSVDTVANFVDKMIRNPADGDYGGGAVAKEARIEFLESLEGINRQIQYVSERLLRNTGAEDPMIETSLYWYLSYRVAQLEVAMLAQRSLQLSHVDIIQDSMLPLGSSSKTRTYFQSYQPKGSRHVEVFVGPTGP